MKKLYLVALLMSVMPCVYSQKAINVGDIVHEEFVKAHQVDPFVKYRKKLPFSRQFLVNNTCDTVFVIEEMLFSEYEPRTFFSYWTHHSLFSAREDGSGDVVFKIKKENFFCQWLMDNVETWNTDSLQSLGLPIPLKNEEIAGTYYAYRIIIDNERILVDSITFFPSKRSIPMSEEEGDELWYRWIGEDEDFDE